MRPNRRLSSIHYGAVALAIGLPMSIYGAITDTRAPTALGIIGVIVAGQMFNCHRTDRIIRETHGPSRAMFERGKQMGYDLGWREGRQSARPVLVQLRPGNDGAQQPQTDFASS